MVKKLLIVNFLLLVAIIAALWAQVSGAYDFLGLDDVGLSEEFLEDFEEVKNYVMEQKDAEEFVRSNEELEDTLSNSEVGLEGYVDLRGYMVTESVEMFGDSYQVAYFTFNEATDETITAAIDAMVDGGNTLNRRSGSTYYLGLGCENDDQIENQNFNISSNSYKKLKKSSALDKIKVRAFFNPQPGTGGPCLSNANGLQVL